MNTRVLELIKDPKIITEADLNILASESEKMPYAQSIRALYLYGINLYESENYKENLSKTAAYTTDKKILYQFINSEKTSKKEEFSPIQESAELVSENQNVNTSISEETKPAESELVTEIVEQTDNNSVLNKFDVEKIIESENKQNSEFVVVDGEKNRLLYEGEENFLEEKTPEVDLDATKESGQLILKEEIKNINTQISVDDNRSEESISTQEIVEEPIIIKAEEIIAEKEPEVSSNDISFGGIQDFLPEVKFSVPKNHLDYLNPPKREKKEEKLVEINLEKKEVFLEKTPEKELEIEDKHGISFENTQAFEILATEEVESRESETDNQILEENEISFENTQSFEIVETKLEEQPEIIFQISEAKTEKIIENPISEWKPMSFSTNIPDALIGKQPEQKTVETKIVEEKIIEKEEEIITENIESKSEVSELERPVFNVSFFGNEVSKIEEKKETAAIEEKIVGESNVGTFINTWQSWLKIDRPAQNEEPAKLKEKIIDNFIETNPRISQLKEESNYVIKEKKDDISHLMTETLAKLYTEQKLYSKAIKAYEILSEKHPQKKDYFKERIEEIKEIRKS